MEPCGAYFVGCSCLGGVCQRHDCQRGPGFVAEPERQPGCEARLSGAQGYQVGEVCHGYGDGADDVRAAVPHDGGCGRAVQPAVD